LVVSDEPVGGSMAGPAIRALELARVLAGHCRVTLAAPAPSRLEDGRIELLEATSKDFDVLLAALHANDIVVAQRLPAQLLRYVQKLPIRYVADLYNPTMIELLEALADAGSPRERSLWRHLTRSVYIQCAAADFVICASEKQRDLWLGGMGLSALIDLDSYRSGSANARPAMTARCSRASGRESGPTTGCSSGVAGSGAGSTR
jgi:hypothetical protein